MNTACIDTGLIDGANEAMRALKRAGLTVVTAESCTAGLIAAALSQADGAGDILQGGFVTYTKENKAAALGIDPALLKTHGSVNDEVVRRMAWGALARSPAGFALAVSGVLGPDPDEDGNPVGLVYFACCRRGGAPKIVREDYGKRDVDELRRIVVMEALALAGRCAA